MITIIYKDNDRTQEFNSTTIEYTGNYALVTETTDEVNTVSVIPLEYIKQITSA